MNDNEKEDFDLDEDSEELSDADDESNQVISEISCDYETSGNCANENS